MNTDPIRAALAAAPPEPVGELVRFPFTVEQLRDQWNAQADEFNQWKSLGLDEQIGWAQARAAARATALQQQPAPGEGEAIGSEWQPCVKLPITVHVREQRPGETHVSTREGVTPVRRDDLIMRGVQGEEYPIGRELFNRTYRLGAAAPAPTVAEGEVEELAAALKVVDRLQSDWVLLGNATGTVSPSMTTQISLRQFATIRDALAHAYDLLRQLAARPAVVPVPVSERLPGPGDCTPDGRCWIHQPSDVSPEAPQWVLLHAKYASAAYGTTLWAPWWALPLPQPPQGEEVG